MAICVNCGKEIKVLSRRCPYCNTPITMTSITTKDKINHVKNDYDCRSDRLFLLSVLIPVVGLAIYKIKGEEEPLKAKSALSGFMVGTVIYLGLIILLLLINLFK